MSCKGGLFNGIIALKNKCDDVNFLMDEKILSINKGDHNFIIHSNKCQYVLIRSY